MCTKGRNKKPKLIVDKVYQWEFNVASHLSGIKRVCGNSVSNPSQSWTNSSWSRCRVAFAFSRVQNEKEDIATSHRFDSHSRSWNSLHTLCDSFVFCKTMPRYSRTDSCITNFLIWCSFTTLWTSLGRRPFEIRIVAFVH